MMDYRTRVYQRYTSEKIPVLLSQTAEAKDVWADAAIDRIKGWLPTARDARIIDVGCGIGGVLYALNRLGYSEVTGVDISPEQVAMARAAGYRVIQQDVLRFLDGQRESVDCVIAFDVIEHLNKDEAFAFLDGCFSALKEGGSIIIQTPNADSPWGLMYRYGDITHEIAFGPDALAHVMRVTGFEHFEARECAPFVHGLKSAVRFVLWRMIRALLMIWNLAEIGNAGSGVYTRVFVARGIKKQNSR